MFKLIKSRPIDFKFCTQVIFDITNLLQLSELDSDPDIKKSISGQTSQKPSKFLSLAKWLQNDPRISEFTSDRAPNSRITIRSYSQTRNPKRTSITLKCTSTQTYEISSKMLTSTIGAKTFPGLPKPDPDIRPSPKSSYEPAGTFESRFWGRLLKNPTLVNSFNLKLPKWEFSFQINSELPGIQFRPCTQVIRHEVNMFMASNYWTTC